MVEFICKMISTLDEDDIKAGIHETLEVYLEYVLDNDLIDDIEYEELKYQLDETVGKLIYD